MFIKPCLGIVTSTFGRRKHPITGEIGKMHWGVDFGSHANNNIFAAAAGTVSKAYYNDGLGNTVAIRHVIKGVVYDTVYGHLNSFNVSVGQTVKSGQVIGIKGTTGSSTGVHLHFEVHKGGWVYAGGANPNAVDPLPLITGNNDGGGSKLYSPTSTALKQATRNTIDKMVKDPVSPINVKWLNEFDAGTLTESDATGLLYVAIERGLLK